MRQETPASSYAAGTKVDSHRSRAELARLLARYGASEFVVVEHDANATIRFALHGKYVQYVLPLPEPDSPFFTHTPTGRPRVLEAQERAYEQAVRQQWRRAVLVMRGKLEAVESGLSSFEREFFGAIAEDGKRDRASAVLLRRRFRWAPETLLLAVCLGVLVPASGGLALGLPSVAVERLTAPVWGDRDAIGSSEGEVSSAAATTVRLQSPRSDVAILLASGSSAGAKVTDAAGESGAPSAQQPSSGDGEESLAVGAPLPGQAGATSHGGAAAGGKGSHKPHKSNPHKDKPPKSKAHEPKPSGGQKHEAKQKPEQSEPKGKQKHEEKQQKPESQENPGKGKGSGKGSKGPGGAPGKS